MPKRKRQGRSRGKDSAAYWGNGNEWDAGSYIPDWAGAIYYPDSAVAPLTLNETVDLLNLEGDFSPLTRTPLTIDIEVTKSNPEQYLPLYINNRNAGKATVLILSLNAEQFFAGFSQETYSLKEIWDTQPDDITVGFDPVQEMYRVDGMSRPGKTPKLALHGEFLETVVVIEAAGAPPPVYLGTGRQIYLDSGEVAGESHTIYGGDGGDRIDGGFLGFDTILGEAGNDEIFGGGNGNDYLNGGTGDDVIHSAGGYSLVFGMMGNDTLNGSSSHEVMDGGTGDDVLIGNGSLSDDDLLYGGSGDDTLTGGRGSTEELLDGGSGNDVLDGGDVLGAGSSTSDFLYGGLGNDVLYGRLGEDRLYGDRGNDFLDGGSGNDDMFGEEGNDTYVVDSLSDSVVELAHQGIDTIQTSVTWTLGDHVEKLVLLDFAPNTAIATGNALDNHLTGNAVDNELYGEAGNDILNGKGGDDRVIGGPGDDIYIVNQPGDTVFELGIANGIDTVKSTVTWTLGISLENLTLLGKGAIAGTGNAIGNLIKGNQKANSLNGLSGEDTLLGFNGQDTLLGGNDDDQLDGGDGNDNLQGEDGNDHLWGGRGNDVLRGGDGKDKLSGDRGQDIFVLEKGAGFAVIQDFQDTKDQLQLGAGLRFKQLSLIQQGQNTILQAGSDRLALLKQVDVTQITAADVI
jgi:Ca2+-binding RTX toxin-like protein